ncbi:hypothetical protein NQ318_003519 [Aromia moschata]|uniref:Trehalase n=1 Tax=Aromia moschata TaxID=1265417 RepID=A0AAV8YVA8_9CUCU|nr:hypothetical protein NQ318_003519 [Aromia moschata]
MRTSGVNGSSVSWCAVILSLIVICTCEDERPPTCSSEIYCHGPLLHTVQMTKISKDSKDFVDMKMKYPANQVLEMYNTFMRNFTDTDPTRAEVEHFVNETFETFGQEFEDWTPPDWIERPKFVDNIIDEEFKSWMLGLNAIWKELGRKMKKEVEDNKELYSIIWVPNPVIVPGGRFREFYYWDSYWIAQGLLHSEMHETVKGMLENFLYIVDNYGHIPNGGRIYYLARSQPPLLVPMIKLYYDYSHDKDFISTNLHLMEKEFDYWMTNHSRTITIDGANYTLAVYGDNSRGPRPESYSEDVEGAHIIQKEAFYSELKAAAESGWDFSSRWFVTNATNKGNLTNIKTRSIVPVDLNAMIYWNAKLLAEFNSLLGNSEKVAMYNDIAATWMKAVTAVLWHEETGAWLDYDLHNQVKRDYFYPTNISPLWTGCYNVTDKDRIVSSVLKYLQNKNIMYPGGIPTTVEHTGEQWDYPNAWPPLQHIMIVGLNNTGNDYAVRLAYEIAETWVRSNHQAYKETTAMYEKYDATVPGGHGGGGEYKIQTGFGWTNGVIMDLLFRYGGVLTANDPPPITAEPAAVTEYQPGASASSISSITTVLIALLVSPIGRIHRRRNQRHSLMLGDKGRLTTARYTELRNLPRHSKGARPKLPNVLTNLKANEDSF